MKISYTKVLLLAAFLSSSNVALAGPNNGYTTAANVYSGSSSRGWYGGGVAHVLAGWKAEADAKSKPETVIEPVTETLEQQVPVKVEATPNDETMTPSSEAVPEVMGAPTPE